MYDQLTEIINRKNMPQGVKDNAIYFRSSLDDDYTRKKAKIFIKLWINKFISYDNNNQEGNK